jgi:hypothetical protein
LSNIEILGAAYSFSLSAMSLYNPARIVWPWVWGKLYGALALDRANFTVVEASLMGLGFTYYAQFEATQSMNDLIQAIFFFREALRWHSLKRRAEARSVENVSSLIWKCYVLGREEGVLTKSIEHYRKPYSLQLTDRPQRGVCLALLVRALVERFNQTQSADFLEEDIQLTRTFLNIYPPGHNGRSSALSNLALALARKSDFLGGDMDILNDAVRLHIGAIDSILHGECEGGCQLSCHLANKLRERIYFSNNLSLLAEVVKLLKDALLFQDRDCPDRPNTLILLSESLVDLFRETDDSTALAEAIIFCRESISLTPDNFGNQGHLISTLAVATTEQARNIGDEACMVEAIMLHRQALTLHAGNHPMRSTVLTKLALSLGTHYF